MISIPEHYFGEEIKMYADDEIFDRDEDDDYDDDQSLPVGTGDNWMIQATHSMQGTANMIMTAQRHQREFCFVTLPAPGTRRVTAVAY